MAKKTSPKKLNHDHNLSDLVGKKIKTITMEEISTCDGGNVRQFYRITCSDGDVVFLGCDGGSDDNQYATAQLYDQDMYDDFLESISDDDDDLDEVDEFDAGDDEDDDDGLDDDDIDDDDLGDGPPDSDD